MSISPGGGGWGTPSDGNAIPICSGNSLEENRVVFEARGSVHSFSATAEAAL